MFKKTVNLKQQIGEPFVVSQCYYLARFAGASDGFVGFLWSQCVANACNSLVSLVASTVTMSCLLRQETLKCQSFMRCKQRRIE